MISPKRRMTRYKKQLKRCEKWSRKYHPELWIKQQMKQNYTYEQLLEKMIRAKISLEKAGRGQEHASWCHAEDLTGHPAPCNCGAESKNSAIRNAIKELEL